MFDKFEYNYVLVVAVLSWISAQVIKTVLYFVKNKTFRMERLTGAGGMPSSHSALVCSATMAVSRKLGGGSAEFAIMFILAIVVMYDAMGVRRAAGMHAREINKMNKFLGNSISKNTKPSDDEIADIHAEYPENHDITMDKELKEFLGHTPFEVLGGAMLGILISLIIPMS